MSLQKNDSYYMFCQGHEKSCLGGKSRQKEARGPSHSQHDVSIPAAKEKEMLCCQVRNAL